MARAGESRVGALHASPVVEETRRAPWGNLFWKKGSPKPPPKNCNPVGWMALRALQPTELLAIFFKKK